eukprot:508110-Pelagomonas_calceolata.AAC.2
MGPGIAAHFRCKSEAHLSAGHAYGQRRKSSADSVTIFVPVHHIPVDAEQANYKGSQVHVS